LHIVHIDTGREMRGGQHQVLLLLKALREAGHQSTLLARGKSPLWNAAAAEGFPVHTAVIKQVWQYSGDADVVHAHDARAHTAAALASRCKFVVSRRVAFPVRRSIASVWKYQRAARFLAVSEFVARELQSAGIRKEKIDIVYDGVEPQEGTEGWRREYPAVALASCDVKKGRDLVEQAAELAHVPVMVSNMGVPVIASRAGGLTEVVAHGVSGILVDNHAREIARAMRSVLDQPVFARRLIEEAKARIAECFTLEHLVRGTLLSYARALAA